MSFTSFGVIFTVLFVMASGIILFAGLGIVAAVMRGFGAPGRRATRRSRTRDDSDAAWNVSLLSSAATDDCPPYPHDASHHANHGHAHLHHPHNHAHSTDTSSPSMSSSHDTHSSPSHSHSHSHSHDFGSSSGSGSDFGGGGHHHH